MFDAARGDGIAHAFVHGGTDGFVEILLRSAEFDEMDKDGLGWQLLGDLVLRAAQDERRDAAFEGLEASLVSLFFDGLAEARVEGFFVAEKSGHEEAHEAPQLAEVVFHRCARKAKPMPRLQFAGRLGDLGARIFDVLRFVEDDEVKGLGLEFLDVAMQQRVRGEYDIGIGHAAEILRTIRAAEY